ncbi:MAG: hypothetical protein KF764_34475 [Labilithrix sp.]|nr:hypothetical protein [Labilithrix sp.]
MLRRREDGRELVVVHVKGRQIERLRGATARPWKPQQILWRAATDDPMLLATVALLNLFSRRNKPLPDVFQYTALPEALRVQIIHILEESLPADFDNGRGWQNIAKRVACEHGLLSIPGHADGFGIRHHRADCMGYILQTKDPEKVLDMVEYSFTILKVCGLDHRLRHNVSCEPDDAIKELNQRFRIHGVGYAYQDTQIVRVDSQLLHAEAVVPALQLLQQKGFKGPNEEFLSAHEHLRHGRTEEAVVDAGKAFESTMKVICDAKEWPYHENRATASTLIGIILEKKLIPTWGEEQLRNLEKCLTGLSTVRNRNAHGAGATPRDVPDHLAAYALHLAASNIVFLVESFNAMK